MAGHQLGHQGKAKAGPHGLGGYEGLIQAQAAIADDGKKDAFGLA